MELRSSLAPELLIVGKRTGISSSSNDWEGDHSARDPFHNGDPMENPCIEFHDAHALAEEVLEESKHKFLVSRVALIFSH